MNQSEKYDVVVIGGGPSGSTLAALLRRETPLKVLVVEKEHFPREHIGESLVHLLIPVLRDTGALEKVLASQCWVQKFGGIYAWDKERPAVTRFDHVDWKRDGVPRWSLHVDRAEFDHILLNHAESLGAEVRQGIGVLDYIPDGDGGTLQLSDGSSVGARLVVDASGRRAAKNLAGRHEHLSKYRNLAVWNHFTGCQFAQTLDKEWNIFFGTGQSPIACFAFENGWAWYIPVPKIINGQRVTTHSIGIVTDPEYIKTRRDLTKREEFVKELQEIPRLCELIGEAKMVDGDMRVVSNYSMICESFCNYDARWMAVGDAAYFVDPLFSSGVTFAVGMAGSACAVARGTLSGQLTERQQRELWSDYTREWRGIAQSFALAIDQWYHAISEQNADSVYWSRRSGHSKSLGIRRATFQALVDTAITPDLLEVLTHGSHELRDLGESGAFLETVSDILKAEPNPEAQLYLGATQIHESFTVDAPGFKASPPPTNPPPELLERIANFWRDPMANNDQLPCPYDGPIPCRRFVRPGSDSGVRFIEERGESGMELFRRLQASPGIRYGKLRETLSPPQQKLLKQLCIAGLVDVKEASALADKPSREGTATLFQ